MTALLLVFLLFVAAALPVLVGARLVHARNRKLGHALLAVVMLSLSSALLQRWLTEPLPFLFASTLVGAVILAVVLGTTLLRGLVVALVAAALQAGALWLLSALVEHAN